MKKSSALVACALMLVTMFIFTACSKVANIADMKISKEDILSFEIYYENGRKTTERPEKIASSYAELEKLSLTKCEDKIVDGVFEDSKLAQICFNVKNVKGKYQMTFVSTTIKDEQVCIVKCEGVNGFKVSKMPNGIYKMKVQEAEQLFVTIFNNIL